MARADCQMFPIEFEKTPSIAEVSTVVEGTVDILIPFDLARALLGPFLFRKFSPVEKPSQGLSLAVLHDVATQIKAITATK